MNSKAIKAINRAVRHGWYIDSWDEGYVCLRLPTSTGEVLKIIITCEGEVMPAS